MLGSVFHFHHITMTLFFFIPTGAAAEWRDPYRVGWDDAEEGGGLLRGKCWRSWLEGSLEYRVNRASVDAPLPPS